MNNEDVNELVLRQLRAEMPHDEVPRYLAHMTYSEFLSRVSYAIEERVRVLIVQALRDV